MTKVKVLLPFVQGKKSFGFGDEISLDTNVAYKFALKGIVEFKTKKEFTELDEKIKADKKAKQDEQDEKERQAAAILEKDELTAKREKHQVEIDAITHILGDGAEYYKVYGALADDLANQKKEGESK